MEAPTVRKAMGKKKVKKVRRRAFDKGIPPAPKQSLRDHLKTSVVNGLFWLKAPRVPSCKEHAEFWRTCRPQKTSALKSFIPVAVSRDWGAELF